LDGALAWESEHPVRVEILARFGAEDSTALVTLPPREPLPQVQVGDTLKILFDGIRKFEGKVSDLRGSSVGNPLVLRAARRPRRDYLYDVRALFLDETPTSILAKVLDPFSGPFYSGLPASGRIIDRLDFQGIPIFYVIDLLAKLAGNWLWWIDWDGNLKMVPPGSPPEHVWYHDPQTLVLLPWQRDRPVKNIFRFLGGVEAGGEFERFFDSPESRERYGWVDETLFSRAINSEAAFAYLQEAVLSQAPWPVNWRAVDRHDGVLSASFGERFELRGNNLPPPASSGQVFRIAAEEILWTEERIRVRYHLAQGYESSTRYTRYLDNDPAPESYIAARVGAFKLDLSALDSAAHLDS
jgi:hypothetical protein